MCVRHWKGIEPRTSQTLHKCYTLGYIPALFKINVLKESFSLTHTCKHALAHGACMHAHTTEGASKSPEEGTGSPAGKAAQCGCWECSLQDMGLYVLLRAILSSYPTPTSALSPETGPSSSVKASLEILVFMPQPSM